MNVKLAAITLYCSGMVSACFAESEFSLDENLYSDSGTTWSTNAGLQLTEFLGIEGFYQDLGKVAYSIRPGEVLSDLSGWGAALTGKLGLSRNLDLRLKAGLMKWEAQSGSDSALYNYSVEGSDRYLGLVLGYSMKDWLNISEDIRLVGRLDRLESRRKRDMFGMVYGFGVQYDF